MTLNPHRYADLGATTRGGGASGGSSIGPSHTGALQLHQLRAIDALYRDRSVTLAAARLCITPSAVSHSQNLDSLKLFSLTFKSSFLTH